MKVRRAQDRGHVNFGWLKSAHTFSFGNYFDPAHMGFANLRVINDDIIAGGTGFDTHPHRDMEIISFVKEGALKHKDSTGSEGIIEPGEIQVMSAGSGVLHSEFNALDDKETKFYQIWIETETKGIKPRYEQKSFLENLKINELNLLVSKNGENESLTINQNAKIYYAKFDSETAINFEKTITPNIWLQVISGSVDVEGGALSAGDGLSTTSGHLNFLASPNSEILLFEV